MPKYIQPKYNFVPGRKFGQGLAIHISSLILILARDDSYDKG